MFLIDNLYKCLEPSDVIRALQREGLPTEMAEKANTWTVQHGPESNVGYFLLNYTDYEALVASRTPANYPDVTLVINGYEEEGTVTFEHLTITNAVNILGKSGTDGSIVLIKLEDYRWWMKRICCGDVQKNCVASNNDFNNDFYQQNTLNTGSLFTLQQILTSILSTFVTDAGNSEFSSATYTAESTLSTPAYHVDFAGLTVLDALCRLCESARLVFTIKPNGNVYFSASQATWPDPASKVMETIDSGPTILPATIEAHARTQAYMLYDDRCSNSRPSNTFKKEYIVPGSTVASTYTINVPYAMQSDYVGNNAAINSLLDEVSARYAAALESQPRLMVCRGYVNFHDSINFGLDKVVYSSRDTGLVSSAIGIEVDRLSLNYVNPPFPEYHPAPNGIFLYRFALKEDWLDAATENARANSDILRHNGPDTNYDAVVYDPFNIFEDLSIGDSGWCFRVCDFFYAMQAPCFDAVVPAPDPPPDPEPL